MNNLIPIIGDLHCGEGGGSELVMNHQLDYLCDVFIPYLEANNIKLFLQTGDLFDVRKSTNTVVLSEWKRRFFDVLEFLGIHMITIVGNHDMPFRNKVNPNAISEHLSGYNNITIIDKVTEMTVGGIEFLMCPWICEENENEIMDSIRNSKARICFGHFEIKGAQMESSVCTDGLAISTFNRYERCISGHFHVAGNYENVQYVGTSYQMSWGDYGITKGFWLLDPATLDMELVENKNEIYHRLTYDETKDMSLMLDGIDYRNQHLKVIIEEREDFNKYEAWLLKLEICGAASLVIIEPFIDRDGEDSDIEVDGELDVKSTTDLIKGYCEDVYPERKEALTKLMLALHSTAQRLHA